MLIADAPTYARWELCSSRRLMSGRTVHFARTLGRDSYSPCVVALAAEVDPRDIGVIESAPWLYRNAVGDLQWHRDLEVIQWVGVVDGDDPQRPWMLNWGRQGVATEMLRLAREITPRLRHAPCWQRSHDGEAFVRATDPAQACRGLCGAACRNPLPDVVAILPEPPKRSTILGRRRLVIPGRR